LDTPSYMASWLINEKTKEENKTEFRFHVKTFVLTMLQTFSKDPFCGTADAVYAFNSVHSRLSMSGVIEVMQLLSVRQVQTQ